jgi:hypothetical protein
MVITGIMGTTGITATIGTTAITIIAAGTAIGRLIGPTIIGRTIAPIILPDSAISAPASRSTSVDKTPAAPLLDFRLMRGSWCFGYRRAEKPDNEKSMAEASGKLAPFRP